MSGADKADVLGGLIELIAERVAAKIDPPQAIPDDGLEDWRLWTLAETAERLTRSERWVRGKARTGELPVVRLDGGALAFDPEDVVAFARSRRVGAHVDSEPRSSLIREKPRLRAVAGDWWQGAG